ncbi:hypothetical protein BBJ28_00011560 [Nothophytophthora sp. Chile5]|nr:hypothetical protein BBJ28_00011560 [Nothophytophthora sp. Chile5]
MVAAVALSSASNSRHDRVGLIPVSTMSAQHPSERQLFYAFCKMHLATRPGGGFLTDQASRLLFKHVKECMSKLPLASRKFEEVTIAALGKFPYRRIELDVLEMYELVVRNPEYAVSATGNEFKYRAIFAEAIIEGEPKVLIDWTPTWEPVGNVPKGNLKRFRDKNRGKRKVGRRAQALLTRAPERRRRDAKKPRVRLLRLMGEGAIATPCGYGSGAGYVSGASEEQ